MINRKRVERIMAERDIRRITRPKRRGRTRPDKEAPSAPDLTGRDFTATTPGTKRRRHHLPTTIQGWWDLATVIDPATCEVIGCAMADHHRTDLVADALKMAAGRGNPQPCRIMRTDCGSKYTSAQFRTLIAQLDLRQSTGRTGACCNNVTVESFFGLLKAEIGTAFWESREQAGAEVFRFIGVECNRTRLRRHPEYGYLTPIETRALLQQNLAPAA